MFAKSKIIRLTLCASLAAVCLLQPTQAKAWEVVRRGPIIRPGYTYVAPRYVAPAPVVAAPPVVVTPPVAVPRPVYSRYWGGYRWAGYGRWGHYRYHR